MRSIAFLLLLSNLVVAGFSILSYRQEQAEQAFKKSDPQGFNNGSIVLLSEYRQQNGELNPQANQSSSVSCTRIVGDWDSSKVESLMSQLEKEAVKHLHQGSVKYAKVSYWLTIPPLADQVKAVAAKMELQRQKVTDVFILKSGERRYGLSLGIFTLEDTAIKRALAVNQLDTGLEDARVESITLYVDRPWIEFQSEQSINELIMAELKKNQLEQTQQSCSR
jgi:hypothetical protein